MDLLVNDDHNSSDNSNSNNKTSLIVIGTRYHLGEVSKKTIVPNNLYTLIYDFILFCYHASDIQQSQQTQSQSNATNSNTNINTNTNNTILIRGVIAVDAAVTGLVVVPSTESDVTTNDTTTTTTTTTISLVDAVRDAVTKAMESIQATTFTTNTYNNANAVTIQVLPVQPWGKFTPALNAILYYASIELQQVQVQQQQQVQQDHHTTKMMKQKTNGCILYCSLETCSNKNNTSSSSIAIQTLLDHMDYTTTLVCGAVLNGHDYYGTERNSSSSRPYQYTVTSLNGCTTPWNTFAVWNITKLNKIGFLSVSDGTDCNMDLKKNIAGVEEVVTIATLQKLFASDTNTTTTSSTTTTMTMMAKLIPLPNGCMEWDTNFVPKMNNTNSNTSSSTTTTITSSNNNDIARQQWHNSKMESKRSRAQQQLELLNLVPLYSNNTTCSGVSDDNRKNDNSYDICIVHHF